MKPGIRRVLASAAPSVVMVSSFYGLALHMHHVLGQWPDRIGNDGFPAALVLHADITLNFFGVLLIGTILLWPLGCIVCLVVSRFRTALPYFLIHAASFCLGFVVMHLAPRQFLNWWWD